ncbi:hypothetical protein C3941_19680 [Kaistia algarum]|nr:hypothetical protein C3941_19680 [Kaistia algarum]
MHCEGEFDRTHIPRAAKFLSCRRALAVLLKHHGYIQPEAGASPQAIMIRNRIADAVRRVGSSDDEVRHQQRLAARRDRDRLRRARQRIEKGAPATIEDMIATVTSAHGIAIDDVMRRHTFADRDSPQARALAEICYRAKAAGYALPAIGKALGGRHHTTIIYQASRHCACGGSIPN